MSRDKEIAEVRAMIQECYTLLFEIGKTRPEVVHSDMWLKANESYWDWKERLLTLIHERERCNLTIEEKLVVRDVLEKRIEERISTMEKDLEEMKKNE